MQPGDALTLALAEPARGERPVPADATSPVPKAPADGHLAMGTDRGSVMPRGPGWTLNPATSGRNVCAAAPPCPAVGKATTADGW